MNTFIRIIDVNLNRLREGLRLLEDVARFIIEDDVLTFKLKEFRHKIKNLIKEDLISHRNSINDFGKNIHTEEELSRSGLLDLTCTSFKRVQESLRVLEEIVKVTNSNSAISFKNLRFEAYDLEKFFVKSIVPFVRKKVPNPLLYLVLSLEDCGDNDPLEIAEIGLSAGVKMLQLRWKILPDCKILELGKKLKSICNQYNALFIVNDRPDIALLLKSDGLHLGQDDIKPSIARKIVGSEAVIGLSCHNIKQLKKAHSEPIDYVGVGPIFFTKTKRNPSPTTGAGLLAEIHNIKIPAVAIGGITPKNLNEIVQFGCRRAAVVTGITMAADIRLKTKEYLEVLQ
ncbi:MAG: thiamine phosphate synthase [Pseudomonadota bacterium]